MFAVCYFCLMSGSVRQISTDRVFLKRFLKYHSILKSLLHYFLDESCTFIWQIVVVWYYCCWFDSPSTLHWRICPHSYRCPQFFLLQVILYFFCIKPDDFHLFFIKRQDGSHGTLSIWFSWRNLPTCGLVPFVYTFNMSDVLSSFPCGVYIFYI